MLGIIGILLSLFLLMYLAYRGITVLVLAPILALLAVTFDGGGHLLATYTEVFMKSLGGYVKAFFPLFLLGALFGRLMDDSGSARSIALAVARRLGPQHALLSIVLCCAILTYGGVSIFVVAFAVFPIASALCREAGIPKRLIPGALALGSFTFTMTALPGTPQIQNSIPMPFFGTTTYAAPVLGLAAGLVMFGLGILWLNRRANAARSRGEGYGHHKEIVLATDLDASRGPSLGLALLPIVVVLGLNFIFSQLHFPKQTLAYLANEPFSTSPEKVVGTWSLILALTAAIGLTLALHWRRFKSAIDSVNQGAYGSMLAILNTASEVGYGNVIASLASFVIVKETLLGLSSNPLVSAALSVTSLAGITGSASGGLSIALGALGKTYLEAAQAAGISPEVLHRVATVACGGLDSLPHNGAVITLLGICGLTHKESYLDIGVCTVIIPLIALVVTLVLGSFGVV